MRFIKDNKVGLKGATLVHHVVQLVPEDLRGADDNWSVRVLFPVSCQDPAGGVAESPAEFSVDGIGKGLERRRVPHSFIPVQTRKDRLGRDPRLSCTGGSTYQDVVMPDQADGGRLERIRLKGGVFRDADLSEGMVQSRINPGPFIRGFPFSMCSSWRSASVPSSVCLFQEYSSGHEFTGHLPHILEKILHGAGEIKIIYGLE